MSTELTDPIEETTTITEQRVDVIIMNMAAGAVEYTINGYEDGAEDPIEMNNYFELFAGMPEGQAKDDFRDVLDNVRALARSKGQLGEGTDTDPIG